MSNLNEEKSPLRQKLIDLGILRPSVRQYGPWDRPPMDPELVARVRKRYLEQGLITPLLPSVFRAISVKSKKEILHG